MRDTAELPPSFCTNADLAALEIAHGWRLVSFDRVSERIEGLYEVCAAMSTTMGLPSTVEASVR